MKEKLHPVCRTSYQTAGGNRKTSLSAGASFTIRVLLQLVYEVALYHIRSRTNTHSPKAVCISWRLISSLWFIRRQIGTMLPTWSHFCWSWLQGAPSACMLAFTRHMDVAPIFSVLLCNTSSCSYYIAWVAIQIDMLREPHFTRQRRQNCVFIPQVRRTVATLLSAWGSGSAVSAFC
jgi:hypothetical protein